MLNKEEKKRLREDYFFYSNKELIEKYRLSVYDLRNFVKAEGLKLKLSAKITPEQKYYILSHPLKPYSELARELGVSYAVVAKVLKKSKR